MNSTRRIVYTLISLKKKTQITDFVCVHKAKSSVPNMKWKHEEDQSSNQGYYYYSKTHIIVPRNV